MKFSNSTERSKNRLKPSIMVFQAGMRICRKFNNYITSWNFLANSEIRDPTYSLKDILVDGRRASKVHSKLEKWNRKKQLKPDRVQEINTRNKTWTTMPLLWWTIPT